MIGLKAKFLSCSTEPAEADLVVGGIASLQMGNDVPIHTEMRKEHEQWRLQKETYHCPCGMKQLHSCNLLQGKMSCKTTHF